MSQVLVDHLKEIIFSFFEAKRPHLRDKCNLVLLNRQGNQLTDLPSNTPFCDILGGGLLKISVQQYRKSSLYLHKL